MNYSQSEINFMRQDALRRTREMHNRSVYNKSNVQAGDHPPDSHEEHKSENVIHQNRMQQNSGKNNSNPINGLLSGLFYDGKIDNDKILIIALIVILAREGADLKLLIALGYIMM
ncbi:hypothetical protein [Porcipelethomonas sp.]|uniref:hypothetical protein n=1 Tax=Porcipelethomonas sp. TaxID=2981675 RepID=UPI003EF5052A